MGKKLAIIGAKSAAVDYAKAARNMGVKTYCFAWKKGAIAIDAVDEFYDISIFEKDKILEICMEIGIDGVVATTELTIPIAAYVAEQLGLNGMPVAVASQITDKYRNRVVTSTVEGLNHPQYAQVRTQSDIEQLQFQYPIIIKPLDKGGKRGISVVNNPSEIALAYDYLIKETSADSSMVVEEYIDGGQEYSVESLSYHGKHTIIQVTQKISSGPPHCVELGHFQPAKLSPDMRKIIENVMIHALDAVGVDNSPCHTEIKIKDNRIYLIEFNARPGGDRIAGDLTELSTGYNYFQGMIKVALGINPNIDANLFMKKYSGIWFITEQTKELKPLFDMCQNHRWCYEKHEVCNSLSTLSHNNSVETDYFIYCTDDEFDPISMMRYKGEEK